MLIISSESGQVKLLRLLLKKGAAINYKEEWTGKTAIFFASLNGHQKAVSLLIKNGAEINIKDDDKRTLLTYKGDFCSVQSFSSNNKCDKQETVKLLLKNNAVETVKLFPDDSMHLKENYNFSSYFEKLGEKPLSSFPEDAFRISFNNYGKIGVIRFDKNEAVLKEMSSGKEREIVRKMNKDSWAVVKQIFEEIYKIKNSVTVLDGDSFWFFEGKFNGSYKIIFSFNDKQIFATLWRKLTWSHLKIRFLINRYGVEKAFGSSSFE